MLSKKTQEIYDYFMAFKYNISNDKVLAVLLHRLCGTYFSRNKAYFTDMFRQLKQWLFGTYRTEGIPQLAYTNLWKSWNLYKSTESVDKIILGVQYYSKQIMELYPEDEYLYISENPIETKPIYYVMKPELVMKPDLESSFYGGDDQTYNNTDNAIVMNSQQPGEFGIPEPVLQNDIKKFDLFAYFERQYVDIDMRCESCNQNMACDNLKVVPVCNHFVHSSCYKNNGYSCPCCYNPSIYNYPRSY